MPTLDFKGKSIIYAHHLTVASRPLEVDVKKSLPPKGCKPSLDDSLVIHGDNLHALKALIPRYAGKVDCIYIDPPYNTGNERWMYNDNVNSSMMKEWLKGKSPVDGEDLERHDKWLCMMWPRLQLLKELLAEDGVIFISIDDNEQHRLHMVMDEIFGEENFVSGFVVIRAEGGGMAKQAIKGHDHLLAYTKDITVFTPLKRPRDVRGKIIVEGGVEYWLEEDWLRKKFGQYGTCHYEEIVEHKGQEKKREIDKLIAAGDYKLIKKGNGLHVVARMRELAKDSSKFYSVLKNLSAEGVKDLEKVGMGDKFDYPKPVSLLLELIRGKTMHTKDQSNIILDSFAGSGTTAQAILALNKQDGGNRRFILVECEDYANSVTAERVRRVIKGFKKSTDEELKNGLGGSFTYCTLGDEISIEKMLTGETLPDYETLARHIFWTATGQSADKINAKTKRGKDGLFYETNGNMYHLIYEPKLDFLRSNDSALNSDRAERIAKQAKKKQKIAVVFATHKFMGQKELTQMGITFCGLPYGIKN